MSARRDSWTKNYEEVDFEVALERDRMLPSPTPTSSASMPVMSQSGATQAATFLSQSVSQPTVASSSSSSGHGHQHQRMPPPTQQDQHDPSGNSFSRSPRSSSFKAFPSSPLNPASPFSTPLPPSIPRSASTNAVATLAAGPNTSPPQAQLASPFGRPGSRQSINFSRMPSDMFNGSPYPGMPSAGSRGSMILYRRAEPGLSGTATPPLQTNHTGATDDSLLPPPPLSAFAINRASTYSTSGDSIISMGSDSKYPASVLGVTFGHGGGYGTERGLVAYAYDPEEDEESDDGEDDWLHDPEVEYPGSGKSSTSGSASSNSHGHPVKAAAAAGRTPPKQYASPLIPWRGIVNISTLALMVAALLCLFAVYPMYLHYKDQPVNARITGNARINSTGQAVEDDFDTVTGGGGPAPTDPGRTRVTQTSINDSGFNPTRRSLWPWKRNNEEWVAALPSTSYKLPYSIPPVQVPPPSERAILSDWKELIDDRTFEIDWHKAIPVSWSTETSPEYIPSIIPPPAEDYSVWDLAYSFIAPWSGALGLNLSLTLTEFPLATTEEWGMWQPSRSDAALDGSSAVSLYSSKRICVPAVNGENDVLVEVGLLVLDYRSRESQEFAARAIKATWVNNVWRIDDGMTWSDVKLSGDRWELHTHTHTDDKKEQKKKHREEKKKQKQERKERKKEEKRQKEEKKRRKGHEERSEEPKPKLVSLDMRFNDLGEQSGQELVYVKYIRYYRPTTEISETSEGVLASVPYYIDFWTEDAAEACAGVETESLDIVLDVNRAMALSVTTGDQLR